MRADLVAYLAFGVALLLNFLALAAAAPFFLDSNCSPPSVSLPLLEGGVGASAVNVVIEVLFVFLEFPFVGLERPLFDLAV